MPDYLTPRMGQDVVFNAKYPKYAWTIPNEDDDEWMTDLWLTSDC